MEISYERVMRLLERRLTENTAFAEARVTVFADASTKNMVEYAEEFARRSAELARYSGAIREIELIMSYIADMVE